MPDQPERPNIELIQQAMQAERLSMEQRIEVREIIRRMARLLQSMNAHPDAALTAMLNIMGSIIGTQFNAEDRKKWEAQILAHLPAYIEAYRVHEKRLM